MSALSQKPFHQKKRIAALWLGSTAFFALLLLARPRHAHTSWHEFFENIGVLLVFASVLGRLWSILHIGKSKNRKLVSAGPYSMTRNPLYFSSMLAIVGVCMMYGSMVVAAVFVAISLLVFLYTARREAEFLRATFGKEYDDYAARTPFFWPKPSLLKLESEVTFSTAALAATFRDALFLVALIPLCELLEFLRVEGYLRAVFQIP